MSMTPSPQGTVPQPPGVALAVSRDPALVKWLARTLPSLAFHWMEPPARGLDAEARSTGAPITVLDDACIDQRTGDRPLDPWLSHRPLLLLVRNRDPERVAAVLDAGADDAMCEPYVVDELRARVGALLRRTAARWWPLDHGCLWYDSLLRDVLTADGRRRRLTPSEAVVMECLLEAGGGVVTREQLLHRLSAQPLQVKSNLVDRHIATLRSKLGDDHHRPRFVATVTRQGYRLQSIA